MTTVSLIIKNLGRNRLRTVLTVTAIALPMLVFTVARSFVDLVNNFLQESDRQMRVAVHQKLTYTTPLPQRIRDEIEQLAPPGYLLGVCRTTWFGGRIEGRQASFPNMAVDRDTFPIVYSEYHMTPEEIQRFQGDPRGAVIGTPLADRMNWKVGDRLTLVGGLPPFLELEFVIAAIPEDCDSPWLYFGLDYYNEVSERQTGEAVGVNNFWLKCSTDQARQWALSTIDRHFANSDHETRTEMESTFLAQFAKSGGDWVGTVWRIGQLVVVVAISVAFNTMSMAFRERTRELAVLRAVGFPARRIVAMVLSEGLLLGTLGGVVAVVPIYLVTRLMSVSMPGIRVPIRISEGTMMVALAVALACGLLAAIVPAWTAGRLRVAPALRKVV